jgi:hypothetical protein
MNSPTNEEYIILYEYNQIGETKDEELMKSKLMDSGYFESIHGCYAAFLSCRNKKWVTGDWGGWVSITDAGKKAMGILEAIRSKELHEKQIQNQITLSVLDTNQSVKSANESTVRLNDNVLPRTFEDQRKFGKTSLGLALISLIFIGLTFWKEYRDKSEQRLLELSQKSDSLRLEMRKIQSSIELVSSSIRSIATDTVLVKKKK